MKYGSLILLLIVGYVIGYYYRPIGDATIAKLV